MRNSRPSKQIVVQRLLPLQPAVSNSYGLVITQEEYLKSTLHSNENNGNGSNVTTSSSSINEILEPKITTSIGDGKKKFWKNNNNNEEATTDNKKKILIKNESITTKAPLVENENSLSDDPGLKSLMEISLPSPPVSTNHEGKCDSEYFAIFIICFSFILCTEEFIYSNNPPMSPMGIIRESPTDPKWYEDNINDFSLSSFLGQLESTCDTSEKNHRHPRDVNINSNFFFLIFFVIFILIKDNFFF